VIKAISWARNHELGLLDKPWHMGTLEEHPLPSAAISSIVAALEARKMLTRHRNLTIRHAIWISRLYTVIKQKDDLWEIAWHYAFNERISEISHTKFDTSEYDLLLAKPKELMEYFGHSRRGISYDNYKTAFEQTTNGINYVGPSMPVDYLVIRDNKVYANFMIQGKPTQLEMPYPDPHTLVEEVKKQKVVKSIKKLKNGETVIRFKETISLGFENKEYNAYLHNLIMGVRNERSHTQTG